jgi:hypothetical protein
MDSIEWILNNKLDKIPYEFSKLKNHSLKEYLKAEIILEANLGLIVGGVKPIRERLKNYNGTLENKKEYVLNLINIYISNHPQ